VSKKEKSKVFAQAFYKKLAGCGAAPHGLKSRIAAEKQN
jgi:hypothetical protein